MTTPQPFITLDKITLRLGERHVFAGTTWQINQGEHWVVVGPNGGGKSTLLGAFNGATPVVGGEVWYHFACSAPGESYPDDGTVPEDLIAYVSQEDQADLAGASATYHQARWNASDTETAPTVRAVMKSRTGRGDTAVRRAAQRVEIGHRLGHPLPVLSNGELRRALIALALLRNPRMIVLDDPFAGLDVDARNRLTRLIADLHADGIVLVVAVRRPEEIPSSATHLLHVANCRVQGNGTIGAMRNHARLRAFFRTTGPALPRRRGAGPREQGKRSGEEIFALNDVIVEYDRTRVLDRVSWTVHAGERWALMGSNGSGKSTLLSLLTGDNPQAYANDVRLFGARRGQGESVWDIRKRIGWVSPELQWYYPGDTVLEDVVASGLFDTIGLHKRLTTKQRREVREWLHRLDLPGALTFAAAGAGLQRLALLARALIKSPALLLLDEPCQGLDKSRRRAFRTTLRKVLRGHPCALVYVTHHAEDLPAVVDRVFRLDRGRAVDCG